MNKELKDRGRIHTFQRSIFRVASSKLGNSQKFGRGAWGGVISVEI